MTTDKSAIACSDSPRYDSARLRLRRDDPRGAACADFAAFAEESAFGWPKLFSDSCLSRKHGGRLVAVARRESPAEDRDVLGPNRKDAPAMKVLLSRSLVCGLLLAGLAVGSSTGCRTGTGWGWPSASSNNWLSWNNWGWGKDEAAKDTALASKPSTAVPKPSASATAQPTTSIAAGTGGAAAGAAAANPTYTATNTPSYPTTNQPTNSYGAQPALAWQNGAANQVQPTVGYQTGPYGMTSQGAAAAGPYSQPSQQNYNAGTSWNPETAAPNTGYGTAASPYGANAAGGMYGTQEPSPYSADPSQGAYGGNPAGPANYGSQPNYGGATTAAPPWNNYSQPQPDYRSSAPAPGASPYASAPAVNYDAVSTAAPSAYPGVPAALATDAGSYRPGSTAAGGVQNAAYNQPQTAGGVSTTGTATYGNTYTR